MDGDLPDVMGKMKIHDSRATSRVDLETGEDTLGNGYLLYQACIVTTIYNYGVHVAELLGITSRCSFNFQFLGIRVHHQSGIAFRARRKRKFWSLDFNW